MFTIPFETLKERAKQALDARIVLCDVIHQGIGLEHRIIDRWDVRCVAQLIALLPECVPRRYRRTGIFCYLDDSTDMWIVQLLNPL